MTDSTTDLDELTPYALDERVVVGDGTEECVLVYTDDFAPTANGDGTWTIEASLSSIVSTAFAT